MWGLRLEPCVHVTLLLLSAAACGGPTATVASPAPSPPPVRLPEVPLDPAPQELAVPPRFPEPANVGPTRFLVVGPLPSGSPSESVPTVDRDLLTSLGGESAARFTPGSTVALAGTSVAVREARLDQDGALDFVKLFETDTDTKVAYAYAEWEVARAGNVLALFGSDDGAAVWVNGVRVHRVTLSRGVTPGEDRFEVPLVAGTNRLLVKVDNGFGGWGFALRLLDDEGREHLDRREARRKLELLDPGPANGSFLLGESFPPILWRNTRATIAFGDAEPAVRWFGPDLTEVERPVAPGRYVAVVSARTLDGYDYRRMLTFAKVPAGVVPPFLARTKADPPRIRVDEPLGLNAPQTDELSRHLWTAARDYLRRAEGGAVAATALLELSNAPSDAERATWLQNGSIRNFEHQLALRLKLEARTPKTFLPPEQIDPPAPTLTPGTEQRAGMKAGTVQKLRALAREWAREDPNGFVMLVARRGVIFFHEGFNGFAKETPFWPASLGKSTAGVLFARAVAQGLLSFDQPLGDVLPEYRDSRLASITFRHCFNHVTGLGGHASHGGLFNVYVDQAFLVQDFPFLEPLTRYRYNGDAYNLAGRALELTTGQSIFRLLESHLFEPLGEPVRQYDLGSGNVYTALYLAKLGQMMLQDGRYGRYKFFEPGFVAALRPRRISEHTPGLDDRLAESGIGQAWMSDPPGPREQGVLGPNVFGHGAASGSVWRVDPDHELLIVVGRDAFSDYRKNDAWSAKLAETLATSFAD